MMKFALFGLLMALFAQASELELRQKITQSLESYLASEVSGIENCENKCEKAFNRLAYQISATDGKRTFEFEACVLGCNHCVQDIANNTDPASCFTYCKNYDWKANGLVKGVIEPDKACIGGCVINTCQVICQGGTTDPKQTKQNKKFFFPNGGCSIKTEPYSQNLEYVPFNSPNTGQGGSEEVAACCANALSLCQYVGNTASTNYQQLLANTGNFCKDFVPSKTQADICAFFNNPQNCGT